MNNLYDDEGEYVIFDNQYNVPGELNPDIPPQESYYQRTTQPPSYYEHNYQQNYQQTNNNKQNHVNKYYDNDYDNDNDYGLVEDLFRPNYNNTMDEKIDTSTLIDIYEQTNEKNAEFVDINFRGNLLPIRLHNLNNITSLIITKCPLDEVSYLPPNLEILKLNKCNLKIVSCKTFPSTIKSIDLTDNLIELITDFENLTNIKTFILDNNNITYINDIPKSAEIVSLKNNLIQNISFLMENIKELYLNNNRINDIEYLLDSIEILDISKNNVSIISLLPLELKVFTAYNCKIRNILCEFPSKLKKLDMFNNFLESVPDFPDSLEWVDLSDNDLRRMPNNIKNLTFFDISNNKNLPVIPSDKSWIDFMQGMQDNKQFMMDIDEDKTNNIQYISSGNNSHNTSSCPSCATSDIDDANIDDDIDENFIQNQYKFKQRILNVHTPTFNNTNKENKKENKEENKEENDDILKNIINNYKSIDNKPIDKPIEIRIKPIRYVKLYKSYAL